MQKLIPQFSESTQVEQQAAFEKVLLAWHVMTGFGHAPIGQRIVMSDRVYEIKSNGFDLKLIDGTMTKVPKRGSYVRVA